MKAVVLEVKNGYAAVLKEDGIVIKIRRACRVGEEIEVSDRDSSGAFRYVKTFRRIAIAAAVILAVLIGTGGYYFTATAATTVEYNSGTSCVTLSLNYFNRVIQVEAVDDEDSDLIETLYEKGIRNATLPEALKKTEQVFHDKRSETEEDSPEILIHTGNDATFERLQNQANQDGFTVKRTDSPAPSRKNQDVPAQTEPEAITQAPAAPKNQAGEIAPPSSVPQENFQGESSPSQGPAQEAGDSQGAQPELSEPAGDSGAEAMPEQAPGDSQGGESSGAPAGPGR